ncbi:MAG: DUF4347 domain-containing protein, partial [Gammaproteobacteria bacterium]|nr:DUF4347 domain-containing protein [Gammaproteobacteria bacterium]
TTDVAAQEAQVHQESAETAVHFDAVAPAASDATSEGEPARREVAFVDTSLDDYQTIVDSLADGIEIHLVDPTTAGMSAMADVLADQCDIDAIHIFSHGNTGQIRVGTDQLDEGLVVEYAEQLQVIGRALSAEGDILLYGCNVATDGNGEAFVRAVAEVTGADVTASDDVTGAASYGGDWELEFAQGLIEAEIAVDAVKIAEYEGVLFTANDGATYNYTYYGSISNGDKDNYARGAGYLNDLYTLSGVSNGTSVTLYMQNNGLSDPYLQITNSSGDVVVYDDDGGYGDNGYDAKLTFNWDSSYTIRATTYSSTLRGDYILCSTHGPILLKPDTAPYFTSSAVTLSITDTSAYDSIGVSTGTITAQDGEGDAMNFSGGGTNSYGTLLINSGGGYTWSPNVSYINSLSSNASTSYTVTVSDGYNSIDQTFTVDISATNDLPVGSNDSISLNEDGSRTLELTDFGSFSDAEGSSVTSVKITTLETAGALQYNNGSTWGDVTPNQVITATDISAGKLRFVPSPDGNGAPYATVGYQVCDAGGAYSSSSYTLTVSVASVNDEPSFTVGGDQLVNEDAGAKSISGWATGISAGASNESSQTLTFTTNNSNNSLFSVQPTVSSNGTLSYTSAANAYGSATVSVYLSDNGGTANGGDNTSPTQTFTITVDPVNDSPLFTGNGALSAVNEDVVSPSGATVDSLFNSLFSDNDPTDTLPGVAITADASNSGQGMWQYSTDGSNWYAIGSVSTTSGLMLSSASELRFVPAADYNGTPGALSVHAVDSSNSVLFTSGAARETFDTTADGVDSAVSDSAVSLSTSITSVDDPTQLNLGSAGSFVEDGGAVAVAPNLTMTDVDDFSLGTVKVSISSDTLQSGDILAFTNDSSTMGNIAASYNATAGVLTLTSVSSSATVGQWQAALQVVTFNTPSQDPDTTARKIDFVLGDAVSLSFDADGDGTDENHYYKYVSGSFTWNQAESLAEGSTFNGLTGYLATVTSAEENLFLTEKMQADAWVGGSDRASEGTWKWVGGPEDGDTLVYGNWTSGEPNDHGSGEDALQFYYGQRNGDGSQWNDLPDNSSTLAYLVEYDDGWNSLNDGNSSFSATTSLSVTAVNDAPVFSSDGSLAAVNEDTTDPAGATVSSLFNSRFTDPDNASSPYDTLAGIVVTADASNSGQGVWQYSTDGGSNWYAIGSVSTTSGLMLSSSAELRFLPALNYNGTPDALSVHAVDSTYTASFTSGENPETFDTTADGADSAVSASAVSLNTSITAVNDPPVVSADPASVTLVEAGGVVNGTAGVNSSTIQLNKSYVDGMPSFDTAWLLGQGWTTVDGGANYSKVGTYGTATLTIS